MIAPETQTVAVAMPAGAAFDPDSPAWLTAKAAFDGAVPLPVPITDWRDLLRRDKAGIYRDEENVRLVLECDPGLTGIARFNEFSGESSLARPIPDDATVVGDRGTPRRWADADTVALTTCLQRTSLPKVSRDRVEAAFSYVDQYRCAYHPLRDYLQGLKWDGRERVTTWIYDYLGATATQPPVYLAAVGTAFLVSAVARP